MLAGDYSFIFLLHTIWKNHLYFIYFLHMLSYISRSSLQTRQARSAARCLQMWSSTLSTPQEPLSGCYLSAFCLVVRLKSGDLRSMHTSPKSISQHFWLYCWINVSIFWYLLLIMIQMNSWTLWCMKWHRDNDWSRPFSWIFKFAAKRGNSQ